MALDPYILRISNPTVFVRRNVTFFDAQTDYGTRKAVLGTLGMGVIASVNIANNLVNYNTLLCELLTSCIVIKRIQVSSDVPDNLRILGFQVQNYDTRGGGKQKPISIKQDPYANLNDTGIYEDKKFILNDNTTMILARILPLSTIDIWFYPERKLQLREAKTMTENEILYPKPADYKKQYKELSEAYSIAII